MDPLLVDPFKNLHAMKRLFTQFLKKLCISAGDKFIKFIMP